jgi:hypothetical protein
MAIKSRYNLYQGINAHFQSLAQAESDGWGSFHSTHITHLMEAIHDALPPGYLVAAEKSLQIRYIDPGLGEMFTLRPKPDLTIFQYDPSAKPLGKGQDVALAEANPISLKPMLLARVSKKEAIRAVVIYQIQGEGEPRPVLRLELLSPSNKQGKALDEYLEKREAGLQAGVILVEVDYLHHSDTILSDMYQGLPNYAVGEKNARPFNIAISDPHQGRTEHYGCSVDEALLPIRLPLLGKDSLLLDFLAVYTHTYQRNTWFSHQVDYAQEPPMFSAYQQSDQLRIFARMYSIIHQARAGQTLNGPPPLIEWPLLNRWQDDLYREAKLLFVEATGQIFFLVRTDGQLNVWEEGGERIAHYPRPYAKLADLLSYFAQAGSFLGWEGG